MCTKDSTPSVQSRSTTTPTGEESVTPVSQPSGLGELSTSMVTETDRKLEAIQRAQVGSLMGADKTKEPQGKTPKKQSPVLAARPKKYALEMWVEIKTSAGVYSTPKEDSYSIDFAVDTLNHTYPGCTSMYLDVAGHMLAFYGKKTNPRAGLLHDQGVIVSKAIANISTWMGYFARWRVRCISISEASEILAGCKRLEKESLKGARWDLQHKFSSMQLHSPLSATARPFQLRATPSSVLVDDAPQDYPAWDGSVRSSPAWGSSRGLPVREAAPITIIPLMRKGYLQIPPPLRSHFIRDGVAEEGEVTKVVVTPMRLSHPEGDERKRIDFLVRSKSLNLEVRRVILMMWPMPSGSGLIVSLITMTIMRIPTSCL